jgi:formiminotetrahydrofolate cyclodeaminase
MQLVEPVGKQGNANVVSDAATALYLANAALHSAIINVNINLKLIKADDFVAHWSTQRDALLAAAAAIEPMAKAACAATLGVNL